MVAGLLATTGLLVAPAPARAASCAGDTGVVVVVDYAELGSGVRKGCDADGGNAASNLTDAGFPLTFASNDPTFVCRVTGVPAADPCTDTPPSNAYWSLWWSDGRTGTWKYASLGVNGLKVPAGGYVAFAWHQGGGRAAPPAVTPTPREPVSSPSPSASTTKGSGAPKGEGRSGGGSPTGSPSSSASAPSEPTTTASPSTKPSARAESAPPSTDASSSVPAIGDITEGAPPSADGGDKGDGFPAWIAVVLAVLVLGAAGAVPLLRRRAA